MGGETGKLYRDQTLIGAVVYSIDANGNGGLLPLGGDEPLYLEPGDYRLKLHSGRCLDIIFYDLSFDKPSFKVKTGQEYDCK